jgi:hypothetical protein
VIFAAISEEGLAEGVSFGLVNDKTGGRPRGLTLCGHIRRVAP